MLLGHDLALLGQLFLLRDQIVQVWLKLPAYKLQCVKALLLLSFKINDDFLIFDCYFDQLRPKALSYVSQSVVELWIVVDVGSFGVLFEVGD